MARDRKLRSSDFLWHLRNIYRTEVAVGNHRSYYDWNMEHHFLCFKQWQKRHHPEYDPARLERIKQRALVNLGKWSLRDIVSCCQLRCSKHSPRCHRLFTNRTVLDLNIRNVPGLNNSEISTSQRIQKDSSFVERDTVSHQTRH